MLSRPRRALLAIGLMPTVLWWACTATVDLDGLTGADDDDAAVVGSGVGGTGGSPGTGGSLAIGGMGGAGGASVSCTAVSCFAVCEQSCVECGAINDGSTCNCAVNETCDIDSGDCVVFGVPPSGACCLPQQIACAENACHACVCAVDATCCNSSDWPNNCATAAQDFCWAECGC
jgi:hypothetical protein